MIPLDLSGTEGAAAVERRPRPGQRPGPGGFGRSLGFTPLRRLLRLLDFLALFRRGPGGLGRSLGFAPERRRARLLAFLALFFLDDFFLLRLGGMIGSLLVDLSDEHLLQRFLAS